MITKFEGKLWNIYILQQGPPKFMPPSELNAGEIFRGDENQLLLTGYYQHDFQCRYNLSDYPFDSQECSINLRIPPEMRNYTYFTGKKLRYVGKSTHFCKYITHCIVILCSGAS